AAAECGASGVADVRFEHPIVVDQPRLIHVFVDAETVIVASCSAAGSAADVRWLRHVRAELWQPDAEPDRMYDGREAGEGPGDECVADAELLEAHGVEGRPLPWSLTSVRHTAGGAVVAD